MIVENDTAQLICYGRTGYDKTKFRAPHNRESFMFKPSGGLWTSPVDSQWGWADWCRSEEFRVDGLKQSFRMEYFGNTFRIDGPEDLEQFPPIDNSLPMLRYCDFSSLFGEADAIHLSMRGLTTTSDMLQSRTTYGWDCETYYIINPSSIQTI